MTPIPQRGGHREELGAQRRAMARTASSHREALAVERGGWAALRRGLRRGRGAPRAAAAREHRKALLENRWLLALADLLEARRRSAGEPRRDPRLR